MVTDALLALFYGLAAGLLDLVPAWAPNLPGLSALGASVGGSASMLNGYFPVVTLFACASVLIGYRLVALAFVVLQWVYSILPLKAT